MKVTTLIISAAGLAAASMAANSQTETLTYSGDQLTGTMQVTTSSGPDGDTVSMYTTPLDGTVTGTVVLASPLPLFGTTTVGASNLESASFNIPGPIGSIFDYPGGPGSLTFTTTDGVITGWNVSFGECPCYGSQNLTLSNPGGDSYSINIIPTPDAGPDQTIYQGNASGTSGEWETSEAPEIDPASAVGGLTLLIGGIAVARGRRVLAG
jgi:hypothetical protein